MCSAAMKDGLCGARQCRQRNASVTNPSSDEHVFAVVVHSKQMLAYDKSIMTKKDERFWATIEREGWVEASSSRMLSDDGVPGDVKTFTTQEEAEKFARRWRGHPWWCSPNGTFEIVKLIPRKVIETKIVGYEVHHD